MQCPAQKAMQSMPLGKISCGMPLGKISSELGVATITLAMPVLDVPPMPLAGGVPQID